MSFAPLYHASFAGALVNQAIALLQRDFGAAIAGITPPTGVEYDDLQEFKKNLVPAMLNTPSIIVGARSVAFSRAGDLGLIPEATRMLLRLEIEDQDPQFATQKAYDYTLALDQVLRSASLADWGAALPINHPTVNGAATAGLGAAAVKDVFIEGHDYGVLWEAPKGFGMRPSMSVLIETEEN